MASTRRNAGQAVFFGLEVVNGQLVRQGIENFAKALPDIGRRRIYQVMQRIYKRLGVYPAPRPRLRYSRTGKKMGGYDRTFQLRTMRQLIKLDQGYAILNDPVDRHGVHYAVYVRGTPDGSGQSRQNRDWMPLAMIMNIELMNLPKEVLDALTVEIQKETAAANSGNK